MVICREFMPYPFAWTTTFDIQPRAKLGPYSASHTTVILPAPADRGGFLQPKCYGSFRSHLHTLPRASVARETDGWPITSIHIPFVENLRQSFSLTSPIG